MKESDIIIAGHGSGNPSTKILSVYCDTRQSQKMSNGMTKGLVEVRRFLNQDQAKKYADFYKELIGRNIYSQDMRQYVYTPYKNGKYYSDCSSSICATYGKCGKNVGLLNTAGMHECGQRVDVRIINGHIVEDDLKKLQAGDALLFRGNMDRAYNGYIGHVESVYSIPEEGHWVQLGTDMWKYKKGDGSYACAEWQKINHYWYFFGYNGVMMTGWQQLDGQWFYLEEKGDYMGACWHETDKKNGSQERWYVD